MHRCGTYRNRVRTREADILNVRCRFLRSLDASVLCFATRINHRCSANAVIRRSERFILAGQLWCNNERIWCLNDSIRKDLKRKPARYNSEILQWISPQAHAPTLPILPCTFSAVSPALCSAFRAPSPSVTSTAFTPDIKRS